MPSVIFFLSGSSALIYQVCWQRLLTLYYGVGSISIAIIVSTFMLGLGIGAIVGEILIRSVTKYGLLYMFIEAAIGVFGLSSLSLLIWIGHRSNLLQLYADLILGD
jgi:spermidine synthase